MLQKTCQQLEAWKSEMKSYEKNKRTKKPFGKQPPITSHVTHSDIKNKQALFNPILQTYTNTNDELRRNEHDQIMRAKSLMNHVRQTRKYERPYDIVNLHAGEDKPSTAHEANPKKLGPLRNAYNIINNQKLSDIYFQNRQLKLPVEREKNLLQNNVKQFNIVTGQYYQNNEERLRHEQMQQKNNSNKKYWKTHDYDPVFGHFYDIEKEQKYQEQRKMKQKQHGKDFESKLPPSYHIPEEMQTIDEKRMNQKKRYQQKYVIQDEYNKRNLEDEEKKDQIVKNKVHVGRIEQCKSKQFDIITMKNYEPSRAYELYNRSNNMQSTWDKLQSNKSNSAGAPTFMSNKIIKTGGFND